MAVPVVYRWPVTNDLDTLGRPTKSAWSRSRPVSRIATPIPWPVRIEADAFVATRPQVNPAER